MFARNASVLFGAALIAAAVTPSVNADQWDKKTVITINEPVQMPSCCNAGDSGRPAQSHARLVLSRRQFWPGVRYYKTKSIEIAKVAKAPVPAVIVETEAELKTAPVAVVDEKGEEKPVEVVVAKAEPPVQPAPEPQATTPVQALSKVGASRVMNQLPAGLEEAGTMLPAKGTNEITHETEDTTQNAATPKNPTLCLSWAPAPALGSNRSSLFRAHP